MTGLAKVNVDKQPLQRRRITVIPSSDFSLANQPAYRRVPSLADLSARQSRLHRSIPWPLLVTSASGDVLARNSMLILTGIWLCNYRRIKVPYVRQILATADM